MAQRQTATEIFEKHYRAWENSTERMKSGYDYERTYMEMMQKVEQEILQNSVGEVPENKNRKKKSRPVSGK